MLPEAVFVAMKLKICNSSGSGSWVVLHLLCTDYSCVKNYISYIKSNFYALTRTTSIPYYTRKKNYLSQAVSPVDPSIMFPLMWANLSQMLSPFPSTFHPPSIWYAAVAAPHMKPSGNVP